MSRKGDKLKTFFEFGRKLAALSRCKRAQMGSIIFPADTTCVCAIGFNGPAVGLSEDFCTGERRACGCAHAEANALVKLDPYRWNNLRLWSSESPCRHCASLIVNSQAIGLVYFDERAGDDFGLAILERGGVEVVKVR